MTSNVARRLILAAAILAWPVAGYAQDAAVTGTVKDTTGAVMPGVSVTAQNEATGNSFEGVTNETGVYRFSVRPGRYRVTAALSGFQTVLRPGQEVLVGQVVTVNFELGISTLQETVTVTGERPLLDTGSSTVAGNIDPRQMEQLPINGRNWMDLTLLAPGSRQNASAEVPLDRQGYFQLVVDGQQITQLICCSGRQPRYSRDAMAEFELITNRFDATVGRSAGMVVNAITKSGTNNLAGSFSGYFRDDSMMAKDHVAGRVLPYSNQQVSGTAGGPIRKDKVHFFANMEYERQPFTTVFSSPFPQFNIDQPGTNTLKTGGGRVDVELSAQSRLAVRYMKYSQYEPNQGTGGATNHPSTAEALARKTDQYFGTFTQVFGGSSTNQIKGGFQAFNWANLSQATWQGKDDGFPATLAPVMGMGSVRVSFTNYNIGTSTNSPQDITEYIGQIRDDYTTTFSARGRHDMKAGGEFLYNHGTWDWCNLCGGNLTVGGAAPANLASLFPDPLDASTWNLNGIPLRANSSWAQSIGNFKMQTSRKIFAFWTQDDWALNDRLTLNLGVRYDLDIGVEGEKVTLLPWLSGNRPTDTNNLAPRLGMALRLDDRTVLRGGYGIYYTQLENDGAHQSLLWTQSTGLQFAYDGRPDFATNPYNGPKPTYANLVFCDQAPGRPGCIRRNITIEIPAPDHQISYSHQATAGIQRELTAVSVVEANYVYAGGRHDENDWNANLGYNPATGANYPAGTNMPFPEWGNTVLLEVMEGYTNYHALETSFRKRMSSHWQAAATYTLSSSKDSKGVPPMIAIENGVAVARDFPFAIAPDIGGEYGYARGDQRHRATFNGIWEVGRGFQVSGLYFFGSGERFGTFWAGNATSSGRSVGAGASASGNPRNLEPRLRPDGTIVPRNNFVGKPIHRVDMRLSKGLRLGRMTATGMFEVFNLFDHANYGSYQTLESAAASYGRPQQNTNVSYFPRTLQLGFKLSF